jgi:hypothetical protein
MFATADSDRKIFVHSIVENNAEPICSNEKQTTNVIETSDFVIDLQFKAQQSEVFSVCFSSGKILLFDSRANKMPVSLVTFIFILFLWDFILFYFIFFLLLVLIV